MNIDKKSITEIKQLADSGEIDLNSLSHDDLQAVFDEEMRVQLESKTYDMTFLNKVAEALGKTDPPEFSEFWQRDYTADDFGRLAENRSFTDTAPNTDAAGRKNGLRRIKRTAAVAACIILAVMMLVLTAYAMMPSFNDMIRRVLGMPIGSSVDDSGITFINAGKTKQYSSLDELIEAENLRDYNIMIPKNLPDELKISSIYYIASTDGAEFDICFIDESVSMYLKIGKPIEPTSSAERLTINGFVVYIDEFNEQCSSMMSYNNNSYYITSPNRDTIITIFEHMSKGEH